MFLIIRQTHVHLEPFIKSETETRIKLLERYHISNPIVLYPSKTTASSLKATLYHHKNLSLFPKSIHFIPDQHSLNNYHITPFLNNNYIHHFTYHHHVRLICKFVARLQRAEQSRGRKSQFSCFWRRSHDRRNLRQTQYGSCAFSQIGIANIW